MGKERMGRRKVRKKGRGGRGRGRGGGGEKRWGGWDEVEKGIEKGANENFK